MEMATQLLVPVRFTRDYILDCFRDSKPIQIVKFSGVEGEAPKFNAENFSKVLENGSAADLPVFVVSVNGPKRSGKSFLLNLMVNYMHYWEKKKCDDSGWKNSKKPIRHGIFKRSTDAVTLGIWIWDHPFIVGPPDSKVALLLMDCQGLGDSENSNPTLENLIIYTSLELSNVFIWNSFQLFGSGDLEKLKLCADYANVVDEETRALFESLIFVVRDFEGDDIRGDRSDLLDRHLVSSKSLDASGNVMVKIKQGILKTFANHKCFAFGRPGHAVTRASDDDKSKLTTKAITKKDFLSSARDLFRSILGKDGTLTTVAKAGGLMSGNQLMDKFNTLEGRLKKMEGDKLILSQSAQILEDKIIDRAKTCAQDCFQNGLKMLANAPGEMSAEELKQQVERVAQETKELFNYKTRHYQESAFTPVYREVLDELLKTKETDLKVVKILRRLGKYERMDQDLNVEVVKELDKTLKEYIERNRRLNPMLENPRWYEDNLKWFKKSFREHVNSFKRFIDIGVQRFLGRIPLLPSLD